MNPDNITSGIASLGLLNGSIRIVPAGSTNRPVFECGGQKGYFQDPAFESGYNTKLKDTDVVTYLGRARFQDVRDGVAHVLSEMSLKAPEMYDTIVSAVHAAGTSCYAVLAPGQWPIAIMNACPDLDEDTAGLLDKAPYMRLFQLSQLADLLSINGNNFENKPDWILENPDKMARTGPFEDGSYLYEGAAGEPGTAASFWAFPVDIKNPWAVARYPDGSEKLEAAVRPMALKSGLLNLWGSVPAGMGWYVAEIKNNTGMSLFRFHSESEAELFVAAQYESQMDLLKSDPSVRIAMASSADLAGGTASLEWTDSKNPDGAVIKWHVHEGYEGFGL